jgi:tol-pal system protein YbgF
MRRAGFSLLLILLSAATFAGGCASGGTAAEGDRDPVKELQDRVLELQRKAAVNEVEISRLRQQVAALTARVGGPPMPSIPPVSSGGGSSFDSSSSFSSSPPLSPPPHAVNPSSSPSTSSSRKSTVTSGGSSTAKAAPPQVRVKAPTVDETDIEVPPASASAPAVVPPPSSAAPPAVATAPPAPVMAGKGEPATPAVQALYDRGYTLYHQKHYVDAEASFQRFLQAEPNSELATNAQYWIGECRYSRGDMRGALAAFRETVARYPQGNKTPDALLKAGMSLEALGDKEGARNTYQDVGRRFPGTAVAAVAEERRAKLP